MAPIRYRTAEVGGFNVFYREAGNTAAPKLLLLHGFPSAGHMFRDLIPLLASRQISHRRSGPSRLRPVRHAAARQIQLHLRQYRAHH
jgi:pimeloyl-ACP methyl ester carboxylesterase